MVLIKPKFFIPIASKSLPTMNIPIKEISKTLAEFYPDFSTRMGLHYAFTHKFLVHYVHENPFNFALHDGVDPTRFVQTRWNMMEWNAGLQPLPAASASKEIQFRRVSDLTAWTQEICGYPSIFIQMPTPEHYLRAFFIAVVFKFPIQDFRQVEETFAKQIQAQNPDAEAILTPLYRAGARVGARLFTLERSINLEDDERVLRIGSLCEWEPTKQHHNFGMAVPVSRNDFVAAVSAATRQGEHIPPAASFDTVKKSITIMAPPNSPTAR
jgi:hypothetical protein